MLLCAVILITAAFFLLRGLGIGEKDSSEPTIETEITTASTDVASEETTKPTDAVSEPTKPSETKPEKPGLLGISVKTPPKKTEYLPSEALDTSGLVLVGQYSNGISREISFGFDCPSKVSDTLGEQKITVRYLGFTAEFSVHVSQAEVAKISVRTKFNKIRYFQGEELDTTGLTLNVELSNGETQIVSEGFICTPAKLELLGNQLIVIEYDGKRTAVDVYVEEVRITQIDVHTMPHDPVTTDGENVDLTGLTLTVSYSDGSQKTISDGFSAVVSDGDPKTVTVFYGDMQTEFVIAQKSNIVSQGNCGENAFWELNEDGVLTISGSGEMDDYSTESAPPWENVKKAVISHGVTSIGAYAFYGQNMLKSISIPSTVCRIAETAFVQCPALARIVVDTQNISYLSDEDGALYTKDQRELLLFPRNQMGKLILPDGVEIIRCYAFESCVLSSVEMPDSVRTISRSSFLNCRSLMHVTIGRGVSQIEANAFSGCGALMDVEVLSASSTIHDESNTLGNPALTAIYGAEGSTAEAYARRYGYYFEIL